ncbi:MAG: hypothetical protein AB7Q27_09305 [Acidimicrobiia bacterium]
MRNPYYKDKIDVGETAGENISTNIRTEWAVVTKDGQLVKCVNLNWRHYPGHSMEIRLSWTPAWTNPCPDATESATEHH